MDKFKFDEKERDELYDLMGVLNHSKKIATLDRIETLISSRADGWVKVEDGLPKPGENVLLHRDKPYHVYDQTGFQRDGIFYFNHGGEVQKVIRWHPLPQPPKTAQQ